VATIKQRPDKDGGGYQVRFYAPDGSRRAKTFAKKKEAQQFATKIEADKLSGNWLDPKLARTPFEEVVATYLDGLVHLAPSTRMKVEGHLRNYILPTFRRFQIANIKPSDVRSWISAMMKHGLSPSTVKAIHGTFSRVMNQAVLDGMIPRSPSFGVKLPKEDHGSEMNVIEPDKLVVLAEALDPRFRALIYTAAYSGLRWSELVALKVHNLDLLKGTIHVRESLVEVNGTLFAGSTKTGVKRTVSIPRSLCDMLGEHLHEFPGTGGHVFTSAKKKPLRRNFYKRHFLPALVKSGLDPTLCLCQAEDCQERHTPLYRFHDLRHTCAALLIAQGAHPKEIQEQLGHSTIRITLDRYGHLFPSLHERLSDGLNEVFKRARASSSPPPSTDAVEIQSRRAQKK
jgi:integrase